MKTSFLLNMRKCLRQICNSSNAHARNVSTKSALASAFNTSPKLSFDIWNKNVGLFGVNLLSTPEGFMTAKKKAISEGWRILDKAISAKPGKETIVLFDELSDTLCKVADLADFVRACHPNSAFVEAANEAHISIGTVVEELNTHSELHKALQNVVEDRSVMQKMDQETQNVAELFLFDFEISGVHLESSKRAKAVQLHEELLHLTNEFMQGSHTSVAVSKDLLPENLKNVFQTVSGSANVEIGGLHAENPNESIREAAFRIFLHQNSHQEEILNRLLTARYELSELVGYTSFSERALKSTMAQTPENVNKFLLNLSSEVFPLAQKDFDAMYWLKKEDLPNTKQLYPWDLHYYTEKLKQKSCDFDVKSYKAFFSLGDCMEGLNNICKSLYGISLHSTKPGKGEVWSDDVIKLDVRDRSGTIGHIYCDFYQRPGKPQQDCHFTIRGGRLNRDGSYQTPIVVLSLHFLPPTSSSPTLLSPSSVNNLFHEMGHALHSMIARTQYQHVTGTRCATDFAEVPSILMEYFASDEKVLSTFAKHYETGEPLPKGMMKDINRAQLTCAATDMQTQVFYSIIDQTFHSKLPLPQNLQDTFTTLHNQHTCMQHIPNTAWYLRFSHLVTYGAKYYAYLMSRAVAARLWNKCFINDPLSPIIGRQYKDKMLSHGGGKNPIIMYEDMLEESFDMENLARTLVNEVK